MTVKELKESLSKYDGEMEIDVSVYHPIVCRCAQDNSIATVLAKKNY